jgi:hypothetical protein
MDTRLNTAVSPCFRFVCGPAQLVIAALFSSPGGAEDKFESVRRNAKRLCVVSRSALRNMISLANVVDISSSQIVIPPSHHTLLIGVYSKCCFFFSSCVSVLVSTVLHFNTTRKLWSVVYEGKHSGRPTRGDISVIM